MARGVLANAFRCPSCQGILRDYPGALGCTGCGEEYPVRYAASVALAQIALFVGGFAIARFLGPTYCFAHLIYLQRPGTLIPLMTVLALHFNQGIRSLKIILW